MLTDNILDLIGNTPIVRLKGEDVYAKAEFLNPGGSIKDRVALAMIEGAERDRKLTPDTIITEPTTTGIRRTTSSSKPVEDADSGRVPLNPLNFLMKNGNDRNAATNT